MFLLRAGASGRADRTDRAAQTPSTRPGAPAARVLAQRVLSPRARWHRSPVDERLERHGGTPNFGSGKPPRFSRADLPLVRMAALGALFDLRDGW